MRVCRAHNIQVELRPPTLEDLRRASGVFITSTSRLVMSVHEVVLDDLVSINADQKKEDGDNNGKGQHNGELPSSYCYPNCITTQDIKRWVLKDVETHSTPAFTQE